MEVASSLAVWFTLSLMCCASCTEDNGMLSERLGIFEKGIEFLSARFNEFQNRISTDKAEIIYKQEKSILNIKTELKTDIRQYVRESLSEILRGKSLEKLIKSEVISEVRHLKRANHQMKRQLHQMKTSFERVEEDSRIYRAGVKKEETENIDLASSSRFLKLEHLTLELADRYRKIRELNENLKELNDSCTLTNKTINNGIDSMLECSKCLESEQLTDKLAKHDRQIRELNETVSDLCTSSNVADNKDAYSEMETTTVSSTSVATTTSLTTSQPHRERSRILLAPYFITANLQMKQLNIRRNSIDIYPYLSLRDYESLIYVPKINSLLISSYKPHRIIISELHTSRTATIRNNIRTRGMAVDEEKEVVFLTTIHPTFSISRMGFHGENFASIVSLSSYGSIPLAIALNPTINTIYACNSDKLFKVFYDGTGLRTLDTGSGINAVTLDITKGLLYYSKEKKLMKMSLSAEITSEVTQFNFYIWNIIFYQNKMYYSSYDKNPGVVGVVDVGHNIVSRTLQTLNVSGHGNYVICLIP